MQKFAFEMETFVTDTEEQDFTLDLQTLNELTHWTRFVLFVAWGAYSQDIYAISWVDLMTGHRDEGFLAYCYVSQRWPAFDFGGTGLYDEDIQELAAQRPWICSSLPPAPGWYLQHISYSVGKIPEASGTVIRRDKHGHANRMCEHG